MGAYINQNPENMAAFKAAQENLAERLISKLKFIGAIKDERMSEQKYELVIVADTNDADYVTEITTVTQKVLDELAPVFEAIKGCTKRHNWPNSEYSSGDPADLYPQLTEDQIEMFSYYCPNGEDGIHTIKSIEYYPLPTKTKVL